MNNEQVELVRQSFDAMWPIRRDLALAFYTRFFELDPNARRLFPTDMDRLHLKLMDAIAAIVSALDDRELMHGIVSEAGRHHAQFGAQPSHFASFGDALIWCLERQFGPAFTPEMKEAWVALYDAVQTQMVGALQERPSASTG
jgi:hemoglobin-like flavoprotein